MKSDRLERGSRVIVNDTYRVEFSLANCDLSAVWNGVPKVMTEQVGDGRR